MPSATHHWRSQSLSIENHTNTTAYNYATFSGFLLGTHGNSVPMPLFADSFVYWYAIVHVGMHGKQCFQISINQLTSTIPQSVNGAPTPCQIRAEWSEKNQSSKDQSSREHSIAISYFVSMAALVEKDETKIKIGTVRYTARSGRHIIILQPYPPTFNTITIT